MSRKRAETSKGRAQALARSYRLVLEADAELGFVGRTVELPLVMADGRTIEACAKAVLRASAEAVSALLERGIRPPAPSREGRREVQINIRLTAEERLTLEAAAERTSARSISDFVRLAALRHADQRAD
jgi:predicted RNase H-like HicB family nuclease